MASSSLSTTKPFLGARNSDGPTRLGSLIHSDLRNLPSLSLQFSNRQSHFKKLGKYFLFSPFYFIPLFFFLILIYCKLLDKVQLMMWVSKRIGSFWFNLVVYLVIWFICSFWLMGVRYLNLLVCVGWELGFVILV